MLNNINKLNAKARNTNEINEKKIVNLNTKIRKKELSAEEQANIQVYYSHLRSLVQESPSKKTFEMKRIDNTNDIKNISQNINQNINQNNATTNSTNIERHAIIKGNEREKENLTSINNPYPNLPSHKQIDNVIRQNDGKEPLKNNKGIQSEDTWLNMAIEHNKNEDANMYKFTTWGNGNQVDIKRNDYGQFVLIPSN
ncbi:hypothetical protein D3029_23710, partial [Escherichia coli]|nr:hypothetical protein [Escherichia coli]